MLRTQVYLPEELNQKKRNAGTTLKEIAALAVEGPGDLSTNLFDYLYGKKSDYARRK